MFSVPARCRTIYPLLYTHVRSPGPKIASSFSYLPGIRLPPQVSLRRSSPHVSFATTFGFRLIPNAGPSDLRLRLPPSPARAQSARGNTRSRSSRRRRVTDPPISCRAPPSFFQRCNTIHDDTTHPRRRVYSTKTSHARRRLGAHIIEASNDVATRTSRQKGRRNSRVLRLGLPAGECLVSGAYHARFPCLSHLALPVNTTRGARIPRIPISAAFTHAIPVTNPSSAASPRTALAPHLGLRFWRHLVFIIAIVVRSPGRLTSHTCVGGLDAGGRLYGAPRGRTGIPGTETKSSSRSWVQGAKWEAGGAGSLGMVGRGCGCGCGWG
ncbi:hypothetical protein B0H13DRAFT_854704 [Mycena leptocephala]|nr:hypothetical protein B0H13DRAFT_854704 [Mycena leptocephala]